MNQQKYIRNFAIVAHIDHGKSTLADRLLEITNTIDRREMTDQILDSNPIEKERGITIKLAPVRMLYEYNDQKFILNLIDTPGHVDFSYEVSRSLSACEGIILVVDATQGIQAQTVFHMQHIKKTNLKVIPVINKIDLPSANIEKVRNNLISLFNFHKNDILEISAKEGINIDQVLSKIISIVPPPQGSQEKDLKALIFTSSYDIHKGVIIAVRIFDGMIEMSKNPNLQFYTSKINFNPLEIGFFTPNMTNTKKLTTGMVGYIATGLKDLSIARVGDTITYTNSKIYPLPGYKEPKPMVFLSLYPTDNNDYLILRNSLDKLHLSDSSFTFEPRSSLALGKGFICGFLGLLHAEIVSERILKEYDLNIISTTPTVEYRILLKNQKEIYIHSPDDFPDFSTIHKVYEPMMNVTIYTPIQTVGSIMQLCQNKRGQYIDLEYFDNYAKFTYLLPLAEMIVDFFDRLKSVSEGYANLDYEFYDYLEAEVVKLDIYLNKEKIDAFSQIVVKNNLIYTANNLVEKLKKLIPCHQFKIPIQASVGSKIVARADIRSYRKDVTAKLYGGDRTRKDKLLEAQKKGKKRMREFGEVTIPQEVFINLYKDKN